jgi:hypothetical protein
MNEEKKPVNIILRYWQFIVIIFVIGGVYASLLNADADAAERVGMVEKQHIEQEKVQTMIQVQLSQIQTDLAWIKEKLAKANK